MFLHESKISVQTIYLGWKNKNQHASVFIEYLLHIAVIRIIYVMFLFHARTLCHCEFQFCKRFQFRFLRLLINTKKLLKSTKQSYCPLCNLLHVALFIVLAFVTLSLELLDQHYLQFFDPVYFFSESPYQKSEILVQKQIFHLIGSTYTAAIKIYAFFNYLFKYSSKR